jgi:hypothetical protein
VHGDPVNGVDPTGFEFTLGGALQAMGIQGFSFGKGGVVGYAARTAAITGLQTGLEAFITKQIYSWFLPGQEDDTDWGYQFAANYFSNFLTGGLKAASYVKGIIDTLINTIADVAIGRFSWLALAVRVVIFAGSEGLAKAGTKLLAKYADDVTQAFPRGTLTRVFDGFGAEDGFSGVVDMLRKKLLIVPSTSDVPVPAGFVPRSLGHLEVSNLVGGDSLNHWGFATILQADGTLKVTWKSGVLNMTPDNLVPVSVRQEIVDAIEAATGRTVSLF